MAKYAPTPTTQQINAQNLVLLTSQGEANTARSNNWPVVYWDGFSFLTLPPWVEFGETVEYANVNYTSPKPTPTPPTPPGEYTINFNSEGGAYVPPITATSGTGVTLPGGPIFANHSFSGWFTHKTGGTALTSPYTLSRSTILYAQWVNLGYTVTFNANNGSGGMSPETNTTATALTTNAFTRTGYTFAHWNTAANGSGTTYTNGATYPFTSSVTLYAQWTITTVTITYNGNSNTGGSAPTDGSSPYNFGSTVTVLGSGTLVDTGFHFNNWNIASNGSSTSYSIGSTFTISGNTTLYAQWITNTVTYTVAFNGNFPYTTGSGGSMSNQTFSGGIAKALTTNAFTDMGYTFTDWNTAANNSGTTFTNGQSVTISGNVTLFAQWTANTNTVTFNVNGGSGSMSNESFTSGVAKALSTNTFTFSGDTFIGWNTAANGSGTSYSNGETITLYGSITLYAQWLSSSQYPSGFTPPAVASGMSLIFFDDFLGSSLDTNWGSPGNQYGAGVNAEGALWAPWHGVVSGSCLNLCAYQDTSLIGQWGVTTAQSNAVLNWVAAETGTSPNIPLGIGTRILVAMRADSLPGLTAIALVTGLDNWPPEIDFVECNAPMTNFYVTDHYGSGNSQSYYGTSDNGLSINLTEWLVWGVEWTTATINYLVQLTPAGPLTVWKSIPNPAPTGSNSFANPMFLSLQYQTNDAIYNSGTPQYPVNSPSITAANPMRQQHDWVQICGPA